MKNKIKDKRMTLLKFAPWLQEKTGAKYIEKNGRTDCVISIDHIDPGCFAALYVMPSAQGLAVFELSDHFKKQADAWQALDSNPETYPPEIFEDWVVHQYLTDRNATVEKIEF